ELVARTMGKNDARKTRKIGERSPTPNHRIASGIQAIGEIGRSIWTVGLNAVKAVRYHPISIPNGSASSSAIPYPNVTRYSDAVTCRSRVPSFARLAMPRSTAGGVGKMGLPPAANHHTAGSPTHTPTGSSLVIVPEG